MRQKKVQIAVCSGIDPPKCHHLVLEPRTKLQKTRYCALRPPPPNQNCRSTYDVAAHDVHDSYKITATAQIPPTSDRPSTSTSIESLSQRVYITP